MSGSEDEIDVLGELPSSPHNPISSYSELLKCDYTIHPQWLLDSATTACWYDNPQQEESIIGIQNASDDDHHATTSAETTKWSFSERKLLQKGIEIYGQDPNRLSVFLGTKSSSEIQACIETEYGINIEPQISGLDSNILDVNDQNNIHPDTAIQEYGEVLADNEIPASMEEVISMVSTAEPTVSDIKKITINLSNNLTNTAKKKKASEASQSRSLLKTSNSQSKISPPPTKNTNFEIDYNIQNDPISIINEVCNKNKDTLLFGLAKKGKSYIKNYDKNYFNELAESGKYSKPSSSLGQKIKSKNHSKANVIDQNEDLIMDRERKSKFNISLMINNTSNLSRLVGKKRAKVNPSKKKYSKQKICSNPAKLGKGNSTYMQIVTGSGQTLPLSEGEQVIKIEKYTQSGAESDIEIDIDSDDDDNKPQIPKETPHSEDINEYSESKLIIDENKMISTFDSLSDNDKDDIKSLIIPDSIKHIMESLEIPSIEWKIDGMEICELEKTLYPDFFEGRPAKTPERYLLIRSHLINSWNQCRPQYLTKTAARHGLRNCGDVNCIGRIHTIMEQIGAINFGCEQTSYIRPLTELLKRSISSASHITGNQLICLEQTLDNSKYDISRQRKKKFLIDGDGGYTITHSQYGEYYQAISEPKQYRHNKKKPTNLIYCKNFTEDNPPPYYVQLSLSALILMDVHSYTSRAEVMGLVGGHYDEHGSIVSIEKYIPCDSLEDSGTHCDMCPVSQSAASEALASSGLETVGWHHSHPLFPPQPSAQDILSQADFQTAFSPHPFLALIVSPFWPPGRTSSQFRCFYTKQESSDLGNYNAAYRFKTHLHCDIKSENDVKLLLNEIEEIRNKSLKLSGKFSINMKEICLSTNMSYLDKCLFSIKYHLRTSDTKIEPAICDLILNGISSIFN